MSAQADAPRAISTHSLLLEIGVEELPSSFVDAALAALPALVATKLADLRLPHHEVKALGTPRRLAIVAHGVATAQMDLDEEVVGPPESAAFKDGKPTKAAEAFATKLGVPLEALRVVEKPAAAKQKAGRYVVGRRVEAGKDTRELLGKALADVCAQIPFKKSMRWGTGDVQFGRPVQWLVALFGGDPIDVAFAGVRAGRESRGHRFLAPASFVISSANKYVEELRAHHVIVDRDERAKAMIDRVASAAVALGGDYDREPALESENASLVEEPFVVTGSFDRGFLELPAAVIRSVARGHQKYFCVSNTSNPDVLLPHYLAVANTALAPEKIAKGNDRVMRARLADARFFFEEDKKASLDGRVEKLAGIVFHNRLGTVREKVTRMEALASFVAGELGLGDEAKRDVKRAAHLCKSDLVSLMVGEFPELQGHMGRAYAKNAGERDAVADAVRDHYRPVGAADAVAPDDVSAVVAIADRLDTLVGCFAIGLSPTGAADPFALRRACIALLRTLIDRSATSPAYGRLRFDALVTRAYTEIVRSGKKLELDEAAATQKIVEFASERLRGLIASETSNVVAEATMAATNDVGGDRASAVAYPAYTTTKARALQAVVDGKEPWLEQARTVGKRLGGISKDATPVLHAPTTFSKPDDAELYDVVKRADDATKTLTDQADVRAALAKTEELANKIDAIFLRTLVNDPADPLTPKRLELLSYGARCMLRIADFSRLA